jgi:hypothetical protein
MSGESSGTTLLKNYWLPCIKAAIALRKNNPGAAIAALEPTVPYELGGWPPPSTSGGTMYPNYLRGSAYLANGQMNEAAAEFRKILDHRGLVWNLPFGVLSHLQLARALSKSAKPQALAEYQRLFTIWADADGDLPILKDAKLEYAKLSRR